MFTLLFSLAANELIAFGRGGCAGTGRDVSIPSILNSLFPSGEKVVQIAAGHYHSLALCESGNVYGWGYGIDGLLGSGNCENSLKPIRTAQTLTSNLQIVSVHCGAWNSAFISSKGQVFVCGLHDSGRIGLPPCPTYGAEGKFHSELTEDGGISTTAPYPSQVLPSPILISTLPDDFVAIGIALGSAHTLFYGFLISSSLPDTSESS